MILNSHNVLFLKELYIFYCLFSGIELAASSCQLKSIKKNNYHWRTLHKIVWGVKICLLRKNTKLGNFIMMKIKFESF